MDGKASYRDVINELSKLRVEFKAEMKSQLAPIKADIAEIKNMYVLKVEFQPVKNVVYGLVATILLSVITAILYLVINAK